MCVANHGATGTCVFSSQRRVVGGIRVPLSVGSLSVKRPSGYNSIKLCMSATFCVDVGAYGGAAQTPSLSPVAWASERERASA